MATVQFIRRVAAKKSQKKSQKLAGEGEL